MKELLSDFLHLLLPNHTMTTKQRILMFSGLVVFITITVYLLKMR